MVLAAFGLKKLLEAVTGAGAPFVLFFGAVAVTSLLAGPGPGIFATLLSLPLGIYELVVRAGPPPSRAAMQGTLFSLDGAIVAYLAHRMDLARRAAKSSRERLMLAHQAAAIASWDLEVATGRMQWSPDASLVLGLPRGEPASKQACLALIHVDDRPSFERACQLSLDPAGDGVMRAEVRVVHPDGALRWVSWVGLTHYQTRPGGGRAAVRQVGTAIDVTERREREDALRASTAEVSRSEARLRDLIELAPDAFFLADLDARFNDVNQAACRLLGYEREELLGKTILDVTSPEDAPRLTAVKQALLTHGVASTAEWVAVRKDGKRVPVEVSSNILPDGRWQAFIRDITERKRAEEALRFSEARFSGMIAIAPDAIISVDEAQRITLFNEGAEKIFGYSRAETLGAPLDLLIPEGARAGHREEVAAFAAGDATARSMGERLASITGRRKNGEEFPAEAAISKLEVDGHQVLTVAVRDITDRKRIERGQQFLAEAGAVLVSSLDYEQTLTMVGQLVVRDLADWCILDLAEHRDRPRRLMVACADPAQAPLAARLEQIPLDRLRPHLVHAALQGQRPFLLERVTPDLLALFSQSDEHLDLLRAVGPRSLMSLPLVLRGELLGAFVLISSTPSRVYGPDDLRLAEAMADRAALAIENGRLYQAAVHATQRRDEVLGVVVHDLRNPLTAIRMQASALSRRGPEPERRSQKARDGILRAANRMDRLIRDLLDVTLIEAGQLGIERAEVATRQLVVDAVEVQRPLASSVSVDMRLELPEGLPDIRGDQHRLLQVLENLIGNAIKFTSGGGRITVGAASRDHEVLFWVADTGCGIAPEDLPHVFDRFWQARKSDLGAGLGLPISRGIIEAHGGRIWVESTLGKGAVFFFTIPAARALSTEPDARVT
jgi:PAS domain S-box-containing protein